MCSGLDVLVTAPRWPCQHLTTFQRPKDSISPPGCAEACFYSDSTCFHMGHFQAVYMYMYEHVCMHAEEKGKAGHIDQGHFYPMLALNSIEAEGLLSM